jgi:phosphatidate phosphatase APP1
LTSKRLIERIAFAAESVERRVDRTRVRIKRTLGTLDRPMIAAYNGFGNTRELHLRGRVLEDKRIAAGADHTSALVNLRMMYRRFASNEIPGAIVQAEFQGETLRARTDEEGYFNFAFEAHAALETYNSWVAIPLELAAPMHGSGKVSTIGRVLVPPETVRFGVISDIDDTVVHTNVTSLVKMARIVALGSARTRMPFAGVAAFYRTLRAGAGGSEQNPIFYLSSSPWNLYDLLHEFLAYQGIPDGPLLLRDWGFSATEFLPLSHTEYKYAALRRILDFYTGLPFILIGDSGEQDPEVYLRAVQEYGSRILAVYIRNIRPDLTARVAAIEHLFTEAIATGVPLKLVPDTIAAANHAAEQGWIDPATLPEIKGETREDKAAPQTSLDIVDEKTDRERA